MATVEQLIEEAKKQVKTWYSPSKPTQRGWVEQSVRNACSPERKDSYTKVFVLEGGEPKGTVIANYHAEVVMAFDMHFTQMKMYRLAPHGYEFDPEMICPIVEYGRK